MKVHWELAQDLRRRLLEPEYGRIGCVEGIPNAHTVSSAVAERRNTELDRPECFIRLTCESLLDLEQPQLLVLSNLCHDAHRSEEFFFANARDQWLRTVIGHEVLHPKIWIEAKPMKEDIPGIIFQSNVLPYDPYWSQPRATENGANLTVHFPSRMLEEALNDRKTLKKTLQEWRDTGKELCDIGNHEPGRCLDGNWEHPSLTSKLFSEIQAADVQYVRVLCKYGDGDALIQLITWRGGQFIQKILKDSQSFDMELEVVKRFSHPHLIYSFGKLDGVRERSYFMEYMSNDLYKFIAEMNRVHGDEQPPFVADATVDILLQVAKAMRHMHEENVDVVHCDLKSPNILISEIATADAVKHYLVKIADFGSARFGSSRSGKAGNFIPGDGTTRYSAPEVLLQRNDETLPIDYPHKIDVYSFGIVASEVLTGIIIDPVLQVSPSKFKDGVIKGTRRPPLRAECKKHKLFIQDEMLLALIERCWHEKPSQRPDFVDICKELDEVTVRISGCKLQTDPPRLQNPIISSLQQGFSNFSFFGRKRR